jgi:hypothetical protein
MSPARFLVAGLAALAAGCATKYAGEAPGPVTAVTGRINYIVNGRSKAPYGERRPAWPAPRFTALRLESGDPYVTPAVDDADGGFRWNLPPGSYVISRIGDGEPGDDALIPWPRVAVFVPPGAPAVYLGHLVLEGVTRGREVAFAPRIVDEGVSGPKSLMFHDAAMPVGPALQEQWQASRRALIERIFGAPAPRVAE